MKAIACELHATCGLPLSRFNRAELQRHVLATGLVADISGITIWRWLREDAIRPLAHRSWICPRGPDFAATAGAVLVLYHRRRRGQPLGPHDCVLSANEKTQIQLRRRPGIQSLLPPDACLLGLSAAGHGAYLATWDVHRAALFGHVVAKISIEGFDALVADVMRRAPYRKARRAFWVVDNGTIHRGPRAIDRLRARWPNLIPFHLPVHASWLIQIEIYFSILQQKALTPSELPTLLAAADRMLGFQRHYHQIAEPFEWRFTRRNLTRVLPRCSTSPPKRPAA